MVVDTRGKKAGYFVNHISKSRTRPLHTSAKSIVSRKNHSLLGSGSNESTGKTPTVIRRPGWALTNCPIKVLTNGISGPRTNGKSRDRRAGNPIEKNPGKECSENGNYGMYT